MGEEQFFKSGLVLVVAARRIKLWIMIVVRFVFLFLLGKDYFTDASVLGRSNSLGHRVQTPTNARFHDKTPTADTTVILSATEFSNKKTAQKNENGSQSKT